MVYQFEGDGDFCMYIIKLIDTKFNDPINHCFSTKR